MSKQKSRILVVEDEEFNRSMLEMMLEEDYKVVLAGDGEQGLAQLDMYHGDFESILLDINMPKMDGYQFMEEMRRRDLITKIPVIIITANEDIEAEEKCLDMGCRDFIKKPFAAHVVQTRVKNLVELYQNQNFLEQQVEAKTAEIREKNDQLADQARQLQENNIKIIEVLGSVVESRNLESGEHVKAVKDYTRSLGMHYVKMYGSEPHTNIPGATENAPLYVDENWVEMVSEAAALHDIGKIAIPDNILLKPGRLTDDEFEFMKSHTTRGVEILESISGIWTDTYKEISCEICRNHHEKWDGRGYPDALKGDEIPLSAQIVSIADCYDALISERCYKAAYSKEEAFHMIISGECGVFNPRLIECFRQVKDEFEALADKKKG